MRAQMNEGTGETHRVQLHFSRGAKSEVLLHMNWPQLAFVALGAIFALLILQGGHGITSIATGLFLATVVASLPRWQVFGAPLSHALSYLGRNRSSYLHRGSQLGRSHVRRKGGRGERYSKRPDLSPSVRFEITPISGASCALVVRRERAIASLLVDMGDGGVLLGGGERRDASSVAFSSQLSLVSQLPSKRSALGWRIDVFPHRYERSGLNEGKVDTVGGELRSSLGESAWLVRSYLSLSETLVRSRYSADTTGARLIRVARTLDAGLREAGSSAARILSVPEVSDVIDRWSGAVDLRTTSKGGRSSLGGVEESWELLRANALYCACFEVRSWPTGPLPVGFHIPLLWPGPPWRSLAIAVQPISTDKARREVRRLRSEQLANDGLQRDGGYFRGAAEKVRSLELSRMESDLVDGHSLVRYRAFLIIYAKSRLELLRSGAELEALAARSGVELHKMYGRQLEVFHESFLFLGRNKGVLGTT